MEALLGRVVYSKAGRDSGRRFVVVKVIDEIYVLISDGDLRKIEKPKKKKIKHLEVTGKVVVQLAEKLNKNLKVTNSEIKKALSVFENESKGET